MLKSLSALGALAVTAVLVVPTVSQAAQPNSVHVSYADLNLAKEAGRAVLHARVDAAARSVCEIEDSRDFGLAKATSACRSDAIAAAKPAVDSAIASMRRGSVTVAGAASLIVTAK